MEEETPELRQRGGARSPASIGVAAGREGEEKDERCLENGDTHQLGPIAVRTTSRAVTASAGAA